MDLKRLVRIGFWISVLCCAATVLSSVLMFYIINKTQCTPSLSNPDGFDNLLFFSLFASAFFVLAFANACTERSMRRFDAQLNTFMGEPVSIWRNILITHAHVPVLCFCATAFFSPVASLVLLHLVLTQCA